MKFINNRNIGELVISENQIQEGVHLVARKINKLYKNAVVITVVPGGILFTADLVRKLNFPLCMDYISCSHTPGDRSNQSKIVFHNNINIEGKDVILIDDAIESGGTMKRLVDFLKSEYSLNSLSIATLFVKPSRIKIEAEQFYAYEMDNDDLLVGYGLPWNDENRNIPYISKLIK